MNADEHCLRDKRIDVLIAEIDAIRRKVELRNRFNNTVMPVSLAGFGATLGLSERFDLKWLMLLIPPCALILASYSILQMAYIFWLDSYVKSKAKRVNDLLGMDLIDYELSHAQSKGFNDYRRIPIGIIWVTWFCFYAYFLIHIYLSGDLEKMAHAYLGLNVLFFALHLVACYRIAYRLPRVAKNEFQL